MATCKVIDKMKSKIKENIDPVPAVYQQQLIEVSASDNLDQVAVKLTKK